MRILIAILCFGLLISCSDSDSGNKGVIAKFGDSQLYLKDVLKEMPHEVKGRDSIKFVKTYVDNWIRNKSIYNNALSNIADKNGELEEQVNRFREELYVNTYEQLFSEQKLDTLISEAEIDNYYKTYKANYILSYDVVKLLFVVLPKKIVNAKLRADFYKNTVEDLDVLKDLCFEHSKKFYLGKEWVNLNLLSQELPKQVELPALLSPKGLILEDSAHVFFVKVTSHIPTGANKPKEMAYEQIAQILLHKRKVDLINTMRKKVYEDAKIKSLFEVYY